MAKKKQTVEAARSSVTGQFVTKAYAKAHPNITQIEHNPKPKPRKK